MTEKPDYAPPSVDGVQVIDSKGPWDTKSGGKLNVLFGLPFDVLQSQYFNYAQGELDKIAYDIRGLRAYSVSELAHGSVGANEWHRVRTELVFAISGSARWTCEDLYGGKRELILDSTTAVLTPPFVIHTYEALDDNTKLLVVTNTLFLPEDPTTHDTYSRESFHELQSQYASKSA